MERITLQPSDPELIGNQDFARDLAEFSAENKIVVELAGGILSHAYYQLRRHGAEVECIDLFGADEDTTEFNKVVRDKVPEMTEAKGEAAEVVTLRGEALVEALRRKLVEESFEALDARTGDDLIAELADALEVIEGIARHVDVPFAQVQASKRRKESGGAGSIAALCSEANRILILSRISPRRGEPRVSRSDPYFCSSDRRS